MRTNNTEREIILRIMRDFSKSQTITSLANALKKSRVAVWKSIKKLQGRDLIIAKTMGSGKTSTSVLSLNWDNSLLAKTLSVYLTERALEERRWRVNFTELEKQANFVILFGSILHSPKDAKDIDLIIVAPKENFKKLHEIISKIQLSLDKKVHSFIFTENEFKLELKRENKAFIDALKKGVILFGQEEFIKFISVIK